MKRAPPIVLILLGLTAEAPACDGMCEPVPAGVGNQDFASLEACPELPPGVAPIEGLTVAHTSERFGGLTITMSTRALPCGAPAFQNDYCHDGEGDGLGLTVAFPAEQSMVGTHTLGTPLYVEYETPEKSGTGSLRVEDMPPGSVELFEITDTCVTGRIIGVAALDGPFDGGFRAPRCTP